VLFVVPAYNFKFVNFFPFDQVAAGWVVAGRYRPKRDKARLVATDLSGTRPGWSLQT